jgi:hypothetical protein
MYIENTSSYEANLQLSLHLPLKQRQWVHMKCSRFLQMQHGIEHRYTAQYSWMAFHYTYSLRSIPVLKMVLCITNSNPFPPIRTILKEIMFQPSYKGLLSTCNSDTPHLKTGKHTLWSTCTEPHSAVKCTDGIQRATFMSQTGMSQKCVYVAKIPNTKPSQTIPKNVQQQLFP